MTAKNRKMALAVLPSGPPFAWRYPKAEAEGRMDVELYQHLARTAERGKFDIFFLADGYSVREDRIGLAGMKGFSAVHFEALTLLSALAMVTNRIGLVATVSTTYNEPYNVARKFASLDYISRGRAGWNIITSSQDAEALNFGLDSQIDNATRYERAREFLEVVCRLWDSWDDEAIVCDRTTGTYFDPDRVHRLNYEGKHFKVRGPLNLPRPIQGHPVLCQAGASETGWEFAAQTADVMYGKAISLSEAKRFYAGVKGKMAKYGRSPDELKILPGLVPIVGHTEKEAWEKFRAVQDCLTPEEGNAMLTHIVPNIDFSRFDFDQPIPDLPEINQAAIRFRIFLERDGQRLTVRELLDNVSAGIGHLRLIGTPDRLAETLIHWVNENGADGFNLMPHYLPGGLEDFVDFVVPELQERNAFRTEYEGGTLRENLGLPRPASRFASGSEMELASL
jgi:N-acetyl-S-(2-succino)cysteine monooxygenase